MTVMSGDRREMRWLVRMPELPPGVQRHRWLLELPPSLGPCALLALLAPSSEGPGIYVHSLRNELGAVAEFHHNLPAFSLSLAGIVPIGTGFELVVTNNTGKAVMNATAYVRPR